MIKEIRMPNAGQTTDTAIICEWKVSIGDTVNRGDVLLEAETDKAVLPVESFAAGIIIDIMANEGDTVDGGDVLCLIGDEIDKKSYSKPNTKGTTASEQITTKIVNNEENDFVPIMKETRGTKSIDRSVTKFPAMPNSKRLAKELGLDIQLINPANGVYVTRLDVTSYGAGHPADSNDYMVMPMNRIRKTIARRMLESVSTIPAFSLTIQVDMRQAIDLKRQTENIKNQKISFNDMIAKAVSVVSKEFSLINARYESDEVRIFQHTNIGFAVGVEDGLVVPVIKKVELLSLVEIASISRALIEKARSGALTIDDTGCGSITISNLGMFGIEQFTAIINPPESIILAIGSVVKTPVWEDGRWIPVEMMTITGSFDHRIIDGTYAARMLNSLKIVLEHPVMMVL